MSKPKKFLALLFFIMMSAPVTNVFATEQRHPITEEPVTDQPVSVAPREEEIIETAPTVTVTKTVTVVKLTASAVITLATIADASTVSSMTKEISTAANELITEAGITLTEAQQTQLTNLTASTKATLNAGTTLSRISQMINAEITTVTTIVETPSISMTVRDETVIEQMSYASLLLAKIAASTEKTESSQVPVEMLPTMHPTTSGVAIIPLPIFKPATYGKKLRGNTFQKGRVYSSTTSADYEGDGIFLNSLGEEVDTIPDLNGEAIPGYLTFVTYMEAGEKYEPVISVLESEFRVAGAEVIASEEVAEITIEVAINEEISPETSEMLVVSSDSFYTYVPSRITEANNLSLIGGELVGGFFGLSASEQAAWEVIQIDNLSFDLKIACILPDIYNISAGNYILGVNLNFNQDIKDTINENSRFWVYMRGFDSSPEYNSQFRIVRESGALDGSLKDVTPYDIANDVNNGAYFIFSIVEPSTNILPRIVIITPKTASEINSNDVYPIITDEGDEGDEGSKDVQPDYINKNSAPSKIDETKINFENPTIKNNIVNTFRNLINNIPANISVIELSSDLIRNERTISNVSNTDLRTLSNDNAVVAYVLPEIKISVSAIYIFGIDVSNLTPGALIFWYPMLQDNASGVSIAGANLKISDSDSDAVFYDDEGNEITTVPDNQHVNVAAYLEAGNTYAPIIATADENSNLASELGGSSGGCDAGLSSMGVLLLVTFFITKRKF